MILHSIVSGRRNYYEEQILVFENSMKSKFLGLFDKSTKWWILWGIFTLISTLICFIFMIFISSFSFLLFEFLPPAFFGLFIYDKINFSKNAKKLFFVFIVFFILIFIFKMVFVWISIGILIVLLSLIKFGKEEFLWSFGTMVLYVLLGFIPLFTLIFLAPILGENYQKWEFIIANYLLFFLFSYFLKGAIFGAIMAKFYNKERLNVLK